MSDDVNVLAVDDVKENLVALATLLTRPGIKLIQARSGREALEALLLHDVALVLLDVNMPDMDGFEVADLMRGSKATREIPIIFLTAATPDRDRVFQGYDAGAVDFLYKPIDPRLLVSKVDVFAQLHRQKRQLAVQLEQIQQAQRMSDLFVAVLGHDLRNPLSSIVAAAELLEAKPHDPEIIKKRAGAILRASLRMERLISQVLDFSLARVKGGIPVKPADADLAQIVRQALAELGTIENERLKMEVRGVTLGSWDADRMMQVVSNLIGNAKEHGDPALPVHIHIDGTEAALISLEVSNGGVISPEVMDHLFSPFKRARKDSNGIGLGLFIVDQIVRAHRGRIVVTSRAGLGTSFQISLPRSDRDPSLSSHAEPLDRSAQQQPVGSSL